MPSQSAQHGILTIEGNFGNNRITQSSAGIVEKNYGDDKITQESLAIVEKNYGDNKITQHCFQIIEQITSLNTVTQQCFQIIESLKPFPNIQDIPFLQNYGVFLLVELTMNNRLYRLSNQDGVVLTHYWDNYIFSFDPPGFQTDYTTGGYTRFNIGAITLVPNFFEISGTPPPRYCAIKIKYTYTSEENAILIFEGTAHLSEFSIENGIKYNLQGINKTVYLLDEDYICESPADIIKEGVYFWHASTVGNYTYYLTLASFENPGLARPSRVMEKNIEIENKSATALTRSSWGYGDYDSLGFTTFYVRIYNDGNPENILNDGDIRLEYFNLFQEKTPFPRAFGRVYQKTPAAVTRNNSMPTYHMAGIQNNMAEIYRITAIESVNQGMLTKFTLDNPHYFIIGDKIAVEQTVTQNGIWLISDIDTDTITVEKYYTPEDIDDELGIGWLYNEQDWVIYEDSVPINSDIIIVNNNGTFSINANTKGNITITGYGEWTEFLDIMKYADNGELDLAVDTAKANGHTTPISYWADSQKIILDFYSELSSSCNHLFYIWEGTLFVVNMFSDNGLRTITDSDYLKDINYTAPPAISGVIAQYSETNQLIRKTDYGYGEPNNYNIFIDTTNINNLIRLLDGQKALLLAFQVTITIPFFNNFSVPFPGERITFSDNNFPSQLNMSMKARNIQLKFSPNESQVVVTGEIQITEIKMYHQLVEYFIRDAVNKLRMNQELVEYAVKESAKLKMNQELIETHIRDTAKLKMNQELIETHIRDTAKLRMNQEVIEILVKL